MLPISHTHSTVTNKICLRESSSSDQDDVEIGRLHTIAERGDSQVQFYSSDEDDDDSTSNQNYEDDDSSLEYPRPPLEPQHIMPPPLPASPPRYDRFVNGEEEKREVSLDDFDGEESSSRLATGAAVVGAGAAVNSGFFGAKALLDSEDGGYQEYIEPNNIQSLQDSSTKSSSSLGYPPNQALETAVVAGGTAASGGVLSEIGKRAKKFLEKLDDDHNDIDHLRNADNADQIVGNYSRAQKATNHAGQAAKAATRVMDPVRAAR